MKNTVIDMRVTSDEPRPHHPNLSPSSLPAIMQCACFVSNGNNFWEDEEDANKGSQMHDYTQSLVAGIDAPTDLSRSDKEACNWAAREVEVLFETYAPGEEIRIEEQLETRNGSGRVISWGYADFNGGKLVIDLKSGLDWRPDLHWYKPQLSDYALSRMQTLGVDRILCVEIYILPNRKREYWITKDEAEAFLSAAIARRKNPEKKPLCCDYCKWCARIVWCPAVNALAWRTTELFAMAMGKHELFACPEKIECPESMSQALTIWKKIMMPLGKRIESASVALAQRLKKDNKEIPYYVLDSTTPREKIVDVRSAFNSLPFDNPTFCKALSTSPAKISEVYAEEFNVPVNVARQTVEGLIGDLIVSGEPNVTLKPLLNNQTKKRKK